MNKLIIFVALPFMVSLVLCMNYGYEGYYGNGGNWGPGYGYGYGNGGGGGGGGGYGYNYGGKGYGYNYGHQKGGVGGVGLRNIVYYPQPTPYYTPFAGNDQQGFDPILGLLGLFFVLWIANITGTFSG